jgi:hypothetical protein
MNRSEQRQAQLKKEIEYTEKMIEVLESEKAGELSIEPYRIRLKALQNELTD